MRLANPLIAGLMSELEELHTERREYEERLASIDREISAAETLLARLNRKVISPDIHDVSLVNGQLVKPPREPQITPPSSPETRTILTTRRSPTQLEWLIDYARVHGGIVRTIEVKPKFIAAGLTKSKPRNILPQIYHLLSRSPEFERLGTGEFRLKSFMSADVTVDSVSPETETPSFA